MVREPRKGGKLPSQKLAPKLAIKLPLAVHAQSMCNMILCHPTFHSSKEKRSISLEGNAIHWLYRKSVAIVFIQLEFLPLLGTFPFET